MLQVNGNSAVGQEWLPCGPCWRFRAGLLESISSRNGHLPFVFTLPWFNLLSTTLEFCARSQLCSLWCHTAGAGILTQSIKNVFLFTPKLYIQIQHPALQFHLTFLLHHFFSINATAINTSFAMGSILYRWYFESPQIIDLLLSQAEHTLSIFTELLIT